MPAGSMVQRSADTEVWKTPNDYISEADRITALLPLNQEFQRLPWCEAERNFKLESETWTWGDGHNWLIVHVVQRYEHQKPVVGWPEITVTRMVSDEPC